MYDKHSLTIVNNIINGMTGWWKTFLHDGFMMCHKVFFLDSLATQTHKNL